MPRILRIHNNQNTAIQGVAHSDLVDPSTMFLGVEDPLKVNGDDVLAQKAGSSIPSMFARMLFFKTVFSSIEPSNVQNVNSLYNQLASQCFDLLEMVYYRDQDLKVIEYNFVEQENKLRQSTDPRHHHFADLMVKQHDLVMPNIQNIYLFVKNDVVIGGTSPWSIVFTSPNWNSGKPVRSLLQRDPAFKDYVYKMMMGCNHSSMVSDDLLAFYNYVEVCVRSENMINNFRGYTYNNFDTDYDSYKCGTSVVYVNDVLLKLGTRPPVPLKSDFFIKSTKFPFDQQKTPLVLQQGQHPGMKYYENEFWRQSTIIPQNERTQAGDRILPDCAGYKHDYITDIDIFEDKLLALPFPINTEKYGYDIPITFKDSDDNSIPFHAMLPIKPVILQYFGKDELNGMININLGGEEKVEISLKIPVFDGGNRNFNLQFSKTYDFNTDVVFVDDRYSNNALTVGISPFYQDKDNRVDDYWIMGAVDTYDDNHHEMNLRFFKHGTEEEMPARKERKVPKPEAIIKLYNIAEFDFLQIEYKNDAATCRCLVVPEFDEVKSGGQKYFYGVDFGTTNTHIAFEKSGGNVSSGSFNESFFDTFATFINITNTRINNNVIEYEDTLSLDKGRLFYPQNSYIIKYSFPIRTVLYESDVNANNGIVFSDASIGFQYVKEIVHHDEYKSDVKWSFLNDVANGRAGNDVRMFFTEILYMIKHHWMAQADADKTKLPEICVTFPGTPEHRQSMQIWNECYDKVFIQRDVVNPMPNAALPNGIITGMVESLAPCAKLIVTHTSAKTNGFLNIDIGGGTTDLQYYREDGIIRDSYYDSIRFAGDDLWGYCYENMTPPMPKPNGIHDNNFTKLAKAKLMDSNIVINGRKEDPNRILAGLEGKELINCLFRDANHSFEAVLGNSSDGDALHRKCRLQILLHYSAIIYHSINWMKTCGVNPPALIKTSGLGSLYLSLIFGNSDATATEFTKFIIGEFDPGYTLPGNFKVEISNSNNNPKTITAEGAAARIANAQSFNNLITPVAEHHTGIAGEKRALTLSDIVTEDVQNDAKTFFNHYIEVMSTADYRSLRSECLRNLPRLDGEEVESLKSNGFTSLRTIATAYYSNMTNSRQPLDQSLFIWALKDSLWKL